MQLGCDQSRRYVLKRRSTSGWHLQFDVNKHPRRDTPAQIQGYESSKRPVRETVICNREDQNKSLQTEAEIAVIIRKGRWDK